jgi:hypothetical protein
MWMRLSPAPWLMVLTTSCASTTRRRSHNGTSIYLG